MILRGDLVHCPSLAQLEVLKDYILEVDAKGFIVHVGPASEPQSQTKLKSCVSPNVIPRGSFLLPTFCDLHLHAPQFLYQGTGLHLPLMQWLNEYAFKAEERIDGDPSLARRVYTRLARRLVEHGTGAVLLFGTIGIESNLILAECMKAAGIRAFIGKLSMDKNSRPTYIEASADSALTATVSFIDRCNALERDTEPHARRVEPVLTPRFVPTCSDELLHGLGRLSEERGVRVQSHMAEALDQVEWVRQERGREDIDVFEQSGLLTSRTIQAHCTFLDAPTLSHVAQKGTAIAHCPLSNAYFSAAPFRLREALDSGVKVGLGTDVAGGYDISIISAMRHAVTVSRMREGARHLECASNDLTPDDRKALSIDWKEALYLATTGGADALGLARGAGQFVVGAPFDAQCIRIIDEGTGAGIGPMDFIDDEMVGMDAWSLTDEIVEKWWCLGDVRNRVKMWIQGKEIARTWNSE
ncbi:Guanine deaminase [Phanerochaete sordida]|uniref:Guanine deaminase n=1 Tax=Phanerochaete sordida TaxID=48140 RepID=A0A9P3GRQ5_9APHY|nr:Guanine deaminase [Phanerochaete sordida]